MRQSVLYFGLLASLPATIGYHLAIFIVTAAIGLGFSKLAGFSATLSEILRCCGSAYVLLLAWLFLRAGATTGIAELREATALNGAILLIFNPKAHLIVVLMFSQFLPASGVNYDALVLWITTVFNENNLVAFTIWTLAGDLLLRRFRSASAARPVNMAFGAMLATVAIWMLLR